MEMLTKKLAVVLLGLALATRLTGLGFIDQVVFDEVHFGKFITAYCCSGVRIFDIHPPHAKLIIAGAAKLGGYAGGFDFDHIGEPYGPVSARSLRLPAAMAGVVLPLIIFGLLRQAGASPWISFMGGGLIVFDNAMALQSRLIALDPILLAATFGALALYWLAEDRQDRFGRIWLFVGAGCLAGLALGTKFTGLGALVLIGLHTLYGLFRSRSSTSAGEWFSRGLLVLAGAVFAYLFGWAVHYVVLTFPGSGDAWQVPSGNFWSDVTRMHTIMFNANYNLTATHPYSSHWWTWPIMGRPVFYWQGEGARLYLIGNPAVWWGGGLLFLTAVVDFIRRAMNKISQGKMTNFPHVAPPAGGAMRGRQFSNSTTRGWMFLLGYIVVFAPFVRIPRALFLYHYFTPLIFSLLFGLWWVDVEIRKRKFPHVAPPVGGAVRGRENRKLTWAVTLVGMVVLAGFVLFSPLTYGFPVPAGWLDWLVWFPSWR